MKIVMLCEFFNETLEFQENLLAKYYTKHRHEVVIITSTFTSIFDYYEDRHDNTWPATEFVFNGVKVIRLQFAFNLLNRFRRYTSIASILEAEKPDLIYVHDIMLNMLEAVAYKKRHSHCRMIMDYHADYSNSGKNWLSLKILHGIMRKWYLDRARKHLSKIFPVVPASAVFLHEVYKVPNDEMELLPLGADTDLGRETRARGDGAKIRQKHGISADALVIFTGGKLAPKRRTELLIEAFLRIADPNLHLFIIGEASDADRDYKVSLLSQAQQSPPIHFVGWLHSAEVYKYLAASTVAIFPAGQSIMWQQAISMHLPLIVGDMGSNDVSELNQFDNIIILKRDQISSAALETCIRRVVYDPKQMAKMKSGAELVTEDFLNWDNLILRTLRFNRPSAALVTP